MNSSDDRKVMAAIIDASFDSLFAIDLNGCIQFANQTAAQVFGYEKEELIGSNISCIVGGGHAASHDGYLQKYKETGVTNLMGSMREVQARRKDGTEFPVKLGIKRVYRQNNDLLVAFIRDITEQKKAEALQSKVQEDQKVRAAILDASFDAMFAINLEGKIELVNLAAIKQFGYDSQEGLVGNNIDMIVGGGHARSHNQYLKKYKDTGVERLMGTLREVKGKRKDGSEFPCIIGIKRVDRNGSSDNPLMVAFIRDITKQKEADALQLRVQEDKSQEDLVGNNIDMIVGGGHATNHDKYLKNYHQTGENRFVGSMREVKGRRKDGSEFPCVIGIKRVNRIDQGNPLMVAFIRDITQQKEMEHLQLALQDERVRSAILDTSFDSLFATSPDGIIHMVNRVAVDVLGYKNENELLGEDVKNIVIGWKGQLKH
ncbi:Sensor protein FixL [Seminavis robusta]|uniref:Sensor protein FixL n=1 Tax=Seminavis robusta TaxID=568900 RepID=A0A9N8D9W8_9STRA|nr:Sensor protein FixL [Seminavis robusta]|eukprot:Sro28_g018750.1 Sensor protein FixL (430) ;mRNA; r:93798-95295